MMTNRPPKRMPRYLLLLIGIYCIASLIHFAHNAEFLAAYPNLPVWLTRSEVYLSWLVVTAVGAAGILLFRFGLHALGLFFIAAYAALGFAGLDHYTVAPMSAHTLAMNATILFEVVAAAVLLAAAVASLLHLSRQRRAFGA